MHEQCVGASFVRTEPGSGGGIARGRALTCIGLDTTRNARPGWRDGRVGGGRQTEADSPLPRLDRLKASSSASSGRKPTAAFGASPGANMATVGMLMIP